MKRLLSIILSLSMILATLLMSSVAYGEEYIQASQWSADVSVDPNAAIGPTYASAYYGLYSKDVSISEDITRQYCFYTPETWVAPGSCVYVVVPSGMTANEFANTCSWMQVAYDNGITVAFLEAQDGTWNLDNLEEELQYITAIAVDLSARTIINYNECSVYIVGYGDGSTVANYAAMNLANFFAGTVLLGTPVASEGMISEIGNTCIYDNALMAQFTDRVDGYLLKDVNMPIWIVNDNEPNAELEAYWKEANDALDKGLRNDYAEVFNQDELFIDRTATYEALSHVWISQMQDAATNYDPEFTEYIWTEFLSQRLRLRAQYNGTLYYNSASQMEKLTYYEQEVDGLKRYWAVYTPESYDGSEATPMVLFTHGHAHGITGFFVNTDLWRTAEKYGFVLVYGLGQPCSTHPLVDCYRWTTSGEGLQVELDYIEMVLDNVIEEYNIDTSRIYDIGHSNGTKMAISIAEYLPERFAGFSAIGSVSDLYKTLEDLPEYDAEAIKYPFLSIFGAKEGNADYSAGTALDVTLKRAMIANGMDVDTEPVEYYNGKYMVRSFYDEENSLPLVKNLTLDDTIHTVLPEFCEISWDYLSGYSRGADGALYFNGEIVE